MVARRLGTVSFAGRGYVMALTPRLSNARDRQTDTMTASVSLASSVFKEFRDIIVECICQSVCISIFAWQ